jgi:hypothetical protein
MENLLPAVSPSFHVIECQVEPEPPALVLEQPESKQVLKVSLPSEIFFTFVPFLNHLRVFTCKLRFKFGLCDWQLSTAVLQRSERIFGVSESGLNLIQSAR